MEFPCNFQIKIIGDNKHLFIEEIVSIARKHFPGIEDDKISTKQSQRGNYLAISITVLALDQDSLDALYEELTSHPDTKMVL